jgi:capsular exopolysaccharide synthesis family protein
MTNRAGLTDVMLQDPSQWNGVLQPTGVNNLSVVMSGSLPPNPSELLGSKRMKQFLEHLHKSCDMVIIDAPPLLPVTDALVLAPMTDGVVLVIDYGSTRIGEALQGKTQLDQSGARLLGVVMNRIPTGRRGYSYYYYYYNRDYYYDGDGSGKRGRSRRGGSSTRPGATAPVADSTAVSLEPSNK